MREWQGWGEGKVFEDFKMFGLDYTVGFGTEDAIGQ